MAQLQSATRLKILEHKGREILLLDYSKASHDETAALTRDMERHLEGLPREKTLRVLFDVRGVTYDPAQINHWKSNTARYELYFKRSAIVTASPFFKVIVAGVRLFAKSIGKPMSEERGVFFTSTEEALDWLAKG